ncbi:MAG: DUF2254 domain-containing protein [Zetaproteobacteria bacterium CG06_land_8_20_14_3_00_59_53]|nr:MAG: hypothetical protein COX56_09810 [Zetaproteobacteria bacterium CG23_combo_of_CG06-09_8_20_14_all_59_86]PIQ65693.1 MAG: hypothetical protein COV97_02255 [Zetaproteobacteria bacterium CG11_big_fil_rev_8_21_14_0_20_59_439]PIU70215.1 MAG: DUF2254 domain-containing protein [Zetaproteobacteria bacterium CG06_land_8_20_14_3_00_59_53]PIU96191.1 MAG: DUF2254 domain-containing protein [Zetaproteobacteria bacterium CG03_land_8_20_14_0_80_59_51]PJC70796.1 MAG: DUF2254 domain-containing protein [Zet
MNKFMQVWGTLRSSFWFMPSLMVAGSMTFAVVLIEVASAGNDQWLSQWPRLFGVGAEGARQMLSTLAGSMITVMGITFSMTLLALVLASGQYTSRILRNFMRSRITQFTLGTFAGIFAYCLIVLRTIRGSGGVDEFVPSLAVFFAFVLSLCGVGVLIYFIHHIASSIQASSIIASIAQETNASIDRLLPEKKAQESDEDAGLNQGLESLDDREWYPVPAAGSGYIQSVDHDALYRLSGESRTIVRMEYGIGTFVVQDTALLSLALTYPPDLSTINAYNGAYSIGRYRTVEQDPAFGIRQIVDIAIKALSPGVNDTSTAIMCVDYLTSIMARLASRQFPPLYRYEGETLRVVAIVTSFEGLLSEAFDQIRGNAEVNVAILARMLGALDAIGSLTLRPDFLRALDEQLQWIAELVERTIEATHERARLERRVSEVRVTLEAQSALCAGEVNG